MPIYEYYCPDNHKIYSFFAKTLAQGETVPQCPDNPDFRMVKVFSTFAIGSGGTRSDSADSPSTESGGETDGPPAREDPRMEAAFAEMEREMESVDENDPRAMGRMMRRMAELTGEPIDGEMEEVVRKLEEGQDPEKLEEEMGDLFGEGEEGGGGGGFGGAPSRDPHLYDY
jgi:hypothetical protein